MKTGQQPKTSGIFIWLCVGFVFFLIIKNTGEKPQLDSIEFNSFIGSVKNNEIAEVTFEGPHITGKFKDTAIGKGRKFSTFGDTSSDYYLKILGDNGVVPKYAPVKDNNLWYNLIIAFVPFIIFAGFLYFMFARVRGAQGLTQIGKVSVNDLQNNTKVKFSDVSGMDEIKEELTEIVDFLKNPEKFNSLGGTIPKGALLVGPPGTGKTLIAKATANEAGVPFFSLSGSDFVEMFVGVGASRVRDIFEQARKHAPCIIFIDEIDAVAKQRSNSKFGGNSELDQTLNQLLVEMDGIDERNKQIIVMGATNRIDILDQAVLRPGRFDRRIIIPLPDLKGREEILKTHARTKKMAENIDYKTLAKGTAGMSGADLGNLLNEAAILAARKNLKEITVHEIEQAKDKILMGTERRTLVINEDEKKRTAYHESGHALLSYYLKVNTIHKMSIVPRGNALGVTHVIPEDNQVSLSKKFIVNYISVLMGGRAAEELVFEEFTTGASDDIKRATDLAEKMVVEWGMSKTFGPVNMTHSVEEKVSVETKNKINEEIKEIIKTAYDNSLRILTENRDKLESLTQALMKKETLSGEEILHILTTD